MRKEALSFLFLLFLGIRVFGQQGSVVIIDTETTNGYGVVWNGDGPEKIVTALHVVAGQDPILVRWGNKTAEAVIEKKLETPMQLPSLSLGNPIFNLKMDYWEVSGSLDDNRLPPPARRETALRERTPLKDINTLLARQNAAFDKALCKDENARFFPGLVTNVFKFAEPNIGKKHSGTPLTFQNQIVGMVNGGAKRIAGRDLVWAIPAEEFINLRDKGVAPSPALTSCQSEALFSGLRSDNPLLSPELRERALELENAPQQMGRDSRGNELVFSLVFRGTYGDLFDSMFEEDQEYIWDLIKDEKRYDSDLAGFIDLKSDIYPQRCDILVEANTGVTIAYPTGSNWSSEVDRNENFIKIESPKGGVAMIIQYSRSGSIQGSLASMDRFKAYLISDGRNWVSTGDGEVDDYLDEEDPAYYEDWWREVTTYEGDILAELYATLEIEGTDFLGVAVVVKDWNKIDDDPAERKLYYLMEACALLTGFPFY
jgi:hypothetical protein